MRVLRWLLIAGALCGGAPYGCAPSADQRRVLDTGATHAARKSQVERADAQEDAIERRVERLRTQLALSEAEVRDLRERLSTKAFRRDTVRIGSTPQAEDELWSPTAQADGSPRPVLRLHGPSDPASGARENYAKDGEAWELAKRLPALEVSAAKPEKVFTAIATSAPIPSVPTPVAGTPVSDYRAALALLRDRKYGSAVRAFDRFIVDHATHAYGDNALYWKGEALYAQRQYAESARAFELLLKSYPDSGKRADALLKLGMSHERRGQQSQAHAVYRRLTTNYPNSVAAQRAPRRN